MREAIERFVNGYLEAKENTFAQHPFGDFVRKQIPDAILETGIVDKEKYLITGSVGQGNWAAVPWVCIFDRTVTTSATKGVGECHSSAGLYAAPDTKWTGCPFS